MTDPKARELAREWRQKQGISDEEMRSGEWIDKLLAAYGSSEYERGLREGREQAAALDESAESFIASAAKHFCDPATTRCKDCTTKLFTYEARAAAIRQGGVENKGQG